MKTVKNPKLFKTVESYAMAALKLLNQDLGSRFAADDWTAAQQFPFIFLQDKLKELPEYKKCFEALQENPTILAKIDVLIGNASYRSRSPQIEDLMIRLPHLGIYKNALVFNKTHFKNRYKDFESTFYEDNLSYEVIAPLSGAVFNESIKIAEDLEISQVNRVDFTRLAENDADGDLPFRHLLWAIRTRYSLPEVLGDDIEPDLTKSKIDEERQEQINDLIEQVVNCLRLLEISNIYPSAVIHRTKSWVFQDIRQYPVKYFPSMQFQQNLPANFDATFVEFWKNFQKSTINKNKFIALAIKRFGYAHERHNWEDRMIDLLIAAEALFLPKAGGQGELKYRLKLHAAIFLGIDAETKKQVFEDMSLAYDLRSKIVHGSDISEKDIKKIKNREDISSGEECQINQFTYRIQTYIRKAICKMINLASANSQENLIDWDNLILK